MAQAASRTERTEARLRPDQRQSWTLDAQDRDFFIKALLNPPEPGPRLIAAAERLNC